MLLAVLGFVLIAVILYYGFRPLRERGRYPPGPMPLPFLGNLLAFRGSKLSTFEDVVRMQKKSGHPDAVTLWFGMTPSVFINTYRGIKQAFIDNQHDFASRMDLGVFDVFFKGTEDIVFGKYSAKWMANKKIGSRLLRKVIESGKLERNVVAATDRVIDELQKLDLSQPTDVSHYTSNIVYNILISLCFSTFLSSDDPKYIELLDIRERNNNPPTIFLLLPFLPFEKVWRPIVERTKLFKDEMIDLAERQLNFMQDFFDEHRANFDAKKAAGEEFDDLVYAIIDEQQNSAQNQGEVLDDATALVIVFDIFLAGTDTTSTTLQWFALEMAANSMLQNELFRDVKAVVGDGVPTLEDRAQLPLVEATIMEVLRLHSAAPLALPHVSSKPGVELFGQYPVASDVILQYNIYAAQRDPDVFENPDTFDPYRFIDGNSCVKPQTLIPFGVGRRVCMGEQLAKNDLFLVVATLLRRVHFRAVPGVSIDMQHEVATGLTNLPKSQKLMIELR